MEITITIPDFFSDEDGSSGTSLQDMVVEAAVQRLVTDARRTEWAESLREHVNTIRDEEIRKAVAPAIEAALTTAVQPTDYYGNPKGEPITLHERIVKDATEWLTKPASDRYGSKAMTPIQRLITEEIEKTFARELRPVMDEAKKEVVAAVKDQGAAVLAETITRMAGVR